MISPQTTRSPSANIPQALNTYDLFLINVTTDMIVKASALLGPHIQANMFLNPPTYAF